MKNCSALRLGLSIFICNIRVKMCDSFLVQPLYSLTNEQCFSLQHLFFISIDVFNDLTLFYWGCAQCCCFSRTCVVSSFLWKNYKGRRIVWRVYLPRGIKGNALRILIELIVPLLCFGSSPYCRLTIQWWIEQTCDAHCKAWLDKNWKCILMNFNTTNEEGKNTCYFQSGKFKNIFTPEIIISFLFILCIGIWNCVLEFVNVLS